MTPEQWEHIGDLYHDALELPAPQRAAFLERVCGNDAALRREVESLLAANEQAADTFIAEPALQEAARLLTHDSLATQNGANAFVTGQTLGQYKIISLLGQGGMGEVYLAEDQRLARRVAIKLLPTEVTNDRSRVQRFIKEARAISALNHPNIITIHEFGEADGLQFLVTEFIEGETLRQQLAAGRLTLKAALNVVTQTAQALEAAHAAGIIHRDIKPENIMIRPDGLVKVLDFGLAKLTERQKDGETERQRDRENDSRLSVSPSLRLSVSPSLRLRNLTEPGKLLGTLAYMSPEQLRGEEVDTRSDLFSLGVVCYELISGARPFDGATDSHLMVSILDHEPAPLTCREQSAPADLQELVARALHKKREARFQSATEFLQALKSFQQGYEFDTQDAFAPLTATQRAVTGKAEQRTAPAAAQVTALDSLPRRRKLKRAAWLACAALAGIAAAFAYFKFARNAAPPLTEKDTVLLADFVNQTGDELFDQMLKQALALQLEQTPFLNFLPDEQVRETLRYMNRPPDSRVTKELAREICQRHGLKALLIGSIAQFDRRYALTLEAINSQTGATIAGALRDADGKEQVLRALGSAATELRQRLGESLTSIQKFDAPLEQATTTSLAALQAWSRAAGNARGARGEAMRLYHHAIELDPNFAKAHVSLSLAYGYQDQPELAAAHAARAFALRARVSERERLDITSNYYVAAEGDLLKAIDALELWRQTYPRDQSPRNRLASYYRLLGRLEPALAAARKAHELNPTAYVPYVNLGTVLLQLNRFDEAQAVIEQAVQRQLATTTSRRDLFYLALIQGDAALQQQQLDWAAKQNDAYWGWHWQAQAASFAGRLRQAEALYARAAELAAPRARTRGLVCRRSLVAQRGRGRMPSGQSRRRYARRHAHHSTTFHSCAGQPRIGAGALRRNGARPRAG